MVISNLGAKPLVLQVPIGSEDAFKVRRVPAHISLIVAL
jgi:hypothetical protein